MLQKFWIIVVSLQWFHVLLVEGIYKGKKGLKIEPPLYAHNEDGTYSNEVRKMFGEKIDE